MSHRATFRGVAVVACCLTLAALAPAAARAQVLLAVAGGSETNSNPGAVYRVDQATGALSLLGNPWNEGLPGVATSSTGRIFAVTGVRNPDDTSHLIEIDPVTGALLNDVGPMWDEGGNGCAIGDLSFQPGTGVLFGLATSNSNVGTRCGVGDDSAGYLMTIDTATARYTIIGRDPTEAHYNGGLAFAANGTLYYVPGRTISGAVYILDPATGHVVATRPMSPNPQLAGLAARASDGLLFGSNFNGTLYTVDPATGATTPLGTNSVFIHDLTFVGALPAEPIPALGAWGEVITIVLLAGLAVAVLRRQLA